MSSLTWSGSVEILFHQSLLWKLSCTAGGWNGWVQRMLPLLQISHRLLKVFQTTDMGFLPIAQQELMWWSVWSMDLCLLNKPPQKAKSKQKTLENHQRFPSEWTEPKNHKTTATPKHYCYSKTLHMSWRWHAHNPSTSIRCEHSISSLLRCTCTVAWVRHGSIGYQCSLSIEISCYVESVLEKIALHYPRRL